MAVAGERQRHHEVGHLKRVVDRAARRRARLGRPVGRRAPEAVFGGQEVDALVAEDVDHRPRADAGAIAVDLDLRARQVVAVKEELQAALDPLFARRGVAGRDQVDDVVRADEAVPRDDADDLLVARGHLEIRDGAGLALEARQPLGRGTSWLQSIKVSPSRFRPSRRPSARKGGKLRQQQTAGVEARADAVMARNAWENPLCPRT